MERRRAILVRFDDICPTMNWEQWNRAVTVLERYNVKPLIGVIPDCQDEELLIDAPRPDFWQYIKDLQDKGYTVAMHGYLHKYDSATHGIVNVTPRSEFLDIPMKNSLRKSNRERLCWNSTEFLRIYSLLRHIPMMKIH